MKITQIKNGAGFTAKIMKNKVEGNIFKTSTKIFLCTNEPKADGDPSPHKLGYKYSWVVRVEDLEPIFNRFDVTEFKLTGKDIKVPRFTTPLEFNGYSIKKEGDQFVFGCGAVKLTKKQIANYVKIRDLKLGDQEIIDYKTVVQTIASREITIGEKELKVIQKLIK